MTSFPSSYKGDIITPSHPDYEASIVRWAANAKRRAKIVAFVSSPEDIAIAIQYAKENALDIAIHGGGHSVSSASSVEDGLVIDLARYMKGVRVDAEKKLAYVGGGAIWATVDEEAMKHGLATVGGTVSHTGVGGLSLGGGWGWLTGRHGMVVDNIEQATIVTANGEILTTSKTENPDLFFGIRGGGSNFGVCAEFVYKLHAQRATVYAGKLVFLPHLAEKLVALVQATTPDPDQCVHFMFTVDPVHRQPCIILIVFYNGSSEEGQERFKPFIELGPIINDATDVPYEKVNKLQDVALAYGSNIYANSAGHTNGPDLATATTILEIIGKVASQSPINMVVAFEMHSLQKLLTVPRDEMAFRRDPNSAIAIVAMWPGDQSGEEVSSLARKTTKAISALIRNSVKFSNEAQSLGYVNLDSDSSTTSTESVFGANYKRMQEVKKKYDPDQIFNRWYLVVPSVA